MFVVKMGPEVGAGGGGGDAGAGAAGGNGAAGAQGAAPGAAPGGAGGKGSAQQPTGAGAESQQTAAEKFHEWDDIEDGKPVKRRASFTALTTSFRREQAVNRKIQEQQTEIQRLAAEAKEVQRLKELREKGDLSALLGKDFKGNRAEAYAKALRAELDREKQLADPVQKELLEKAARLEEVEGKLDQVEREKYEREFNAEVERNLEEISERYMKALETMKLPKNDITLSLMAGADRTNKQLGLKLTDAQLAAETMKGAAEMVDGLLDNLSPLQALETFPKLARLIHQGLIERGNQRKNGTQAQQLAPKEKRERQQEEKTTEPKISDAAEIRKRTGVFGLI